MTKVRPLHDRLLVRRLRGPAASLAQVIQDVNNEPTAPPPANWKGKAVL